jgi:monoamine oxidase
MDVAIVGGGVAGCYSAYRLAKARPDWKVELFEASDRFGGRLWSVPIAGSDEAPAEMGAMFVGDKHHTLYPLIVDELGLKLNPLRWSHRHQYLRDVYLTDASYSSDDTTVPFRVEDSEKKKHPVTLLIYAMGQIVPGLEDLWPLNPKAAPSATYDRLRALSHQGRPLYQWGFWNVLSDVISNEAYNLLLSTIGLGSIFRNANALEAIWTMLRNIDPSQTYYRIAGGYQELPLALLAGAKDVVRINAGHRLSALSHNGKRFTLRFETAFGEQKKKADKVILALPRRALQLIDLDEAMLGDARQFKCNLDGVLSAPACKVFLSFDEAWWDRSKFGPSLLDPNDVAVAFTDLPMRQCFYFGKPKASDGPAVLMAAYTDDTATSYWSGLACGDDDSFSNPALNERDQQALWCSRPTVNAALKQLGAMHYDEPPPQPTGALFVDWSRDPYGAAWHDWAPNVRSWRVGPKMRHPNKSLDLFICGEAYSQRQGWVEGALSSAEMVLGQIGLKPPRWLGDKAREFEVEGNPDMSNPLQKLLVAFSESMALQDAYAHDPDAICKAFGLGDAEKAALKAGDEKSIKALAGNVGTLNVVVRIVK